MVGDLSNFPAANISFLKIFLYEVKNVGPQHGTPEMKIQERSIL